MKERIEIELVDERGEVTGRGEKYEVHKIPVPLHRAISVVIFDPEEQKILIQKRAETKLTWPLFWSNAVCTHPYPEEDYQDAAGRRLKEELGIETQLTEVFRFTYQAEYGDLWGEHEYDVVFTGKYAGNVSPDPKEVADYKWVGISELREDVLKNPDSYSPWFEIILQKLNILPSDFAPAQNE